MAFFFPTMVSVAVHFNFPSHLTCIFVLNTSFSKAESATIGFIVEPGAYNPDNVLFNKGLSGSFLISFHFLSQFHIKIGLDQMKEKNSWQ